MRRPLLGGMLKSAQGGRLWLAQGQMHHSHVRVVLVDPRVQVTGLAERHERQSYTLAYIREEISQMRGEVLPASWNQVNTRQIRVA